MQSVPVTLHYEEDGKREQKIPSLCIYLCWKATNFAPENTLFKVCKFVTESVTFAEKITFFFVPYVLSK